MKALILFSELAGYFYDCLQTLINQTIIDEVWIFAWRASADAPYKFDKIKGIRIIYCEDYSQEDLEHLAFSFSPEIVYLSGWSNDLYLRLGRKFRKQTIPVVMGLDNQWSGSVRQQIARFVFPFLYRRSSTHIWVAGIYQYEFARRLGYAKQQILFNLYSANVALFEKGVGQAVEIKQKGYPKIILFIGRFVPEKGIDLLLKTFSAINMEQGAEWQLWLVGNGPLKETIREDKSIKVLNFVQPHELPQLMYSCGVFCLPSRTENWGVVLHEAAAAGLPILSSDACGAATAFVKHGFNGFIFQSGNRVSLERYLKKIMSLPDERLLQMANYSSECAKQITPQIWAATFTSVIKK